MASAGMTWSEGQFPRAPVRRPDLRASFAGGAARRRPDAVDSDAPRQKTVGEETGRLRLPGGMRCSDAYSLCAVSKEHFCKCCCPVSARHGHEEPDYIFQVMNPSELLPVRLEDVNKI